MTTGRTTPALCACEDVAGANAGDYVVKLFGGTERRYRGMLSEFVASRLASYFGIATADPALVGIDEELATLVASIHGPAAANFQASVGPNFGCRHLTDVSSPPVDGSIPEASWAQAVNVFAFDALIQNPDRRFNNPNLFLRGDGILVFDHELAVSFLEELLPLSKPWAIQSLRFLDDHVFFRRLRKRPLDLDQFTGALAALTQPTLASMLAAVPEPWNNEDVARIEDHLLTVAGNAAAFAEEVRRRLA